MSRLPEAGRRILLPIRVRLALWYSLLMGGMLLLVALVVTQVVTSSLAQSVDNALRDQAEQVIHQSRLVTNGWSTGLALPPQQNLSSQNIFVQVTGQDQQVLRTSENLLTFRLPISAGARAVLAGAEPQYETLLVAGEPLRIYDAPLAVPNQILGVIQVAEPLGAINDTIANVRLVLAITGILAFVAALGLGWLVSRQALRPLGRLTRTAERIGQDRDFTRRVPYAGPADEVGRLAGTFNIMLDRLQSAYADSQEAAHRLETALTAQKRFVGDASHELRTPLTAIRGNAELLQRQPQMDPADRQASVAEIADEAQRMSRLVGDLLALARADAGQHLARTSVAIAPVVRGAVAAARHLPSAAALMLVEPLPEATVLGDADYLKQLVLILLDNGLKYTPAEGRVTVAVAVREAQVELTVADTGCGIAAEDLPHIFDRFYRADRARTAGGTGLGLAIAAWIVDEHGGRMRVQSAPGVGSIFSVALPQALAAPPVEAAPPVPHSEPQPALLGEAQPVAAEFLTRF